MARIDFESNFDAARILEDFLNRKLVGMKRAAEFALGDIVTRTGGGVGLEGSFPGYSPSYRKFREKRGNPVGHVDLHLTGQMLQSITTDVSRQGDRLIAEIAPAPAQNAKVVGTHSDRPWFGLRPEEEARAVRTIEEA